MTDCRIAQSPNDKVSDHLLVGGIYSVLADQRGKGDFVLAKVVHLTEAVVHVVIYPQSFKYRPSEKSLSQGKLTLAGDLIEARERHVAMSRKLFALIRPVFAVEAALVDHDLAGYRQWSLLGDGEVLEAPSYIEPENNDGVYKRIFILCGLPFGLLQGAYHYFRDGMIAGVCAFLFGFAIFGAGMVASQYIAVHKRLRDKDSRDGEKKSARSQSASAFQVAEISLDKNFGDTFDLCKQAVRTIKNCRVLEEDASGGTLEGRVGFSLTSEGEHIVVTSFVIAPEKTGVVVASMPRAGGEVDLGKNFDNVARIVSHLKTACK
jgi:hypothetical protein